MAPAPGQFIAPWARSDVNGYAGGGNKVEKLEIMVEKPIVSLCVVATKHLTCNR